MTFAEAFAARGIPEPKLRTYAQIQADNRKRREDRPKCFPDQSTISTYTWHRNPDQASRDLAALRQTNSTAEYISIWCRLNHLTY